MLEWSKAVGDSVEADETIVEISTDKVDAEVPAPASGTLTEILAEAGDTVTVGQVIGRLSAVAAGRRPRHGARARARRRAATRHRRRRRGARRRQGHAGRAPRRRGARDRPGQRARHRARRPHLQGGRAGRRERRATARPRPPQARGRTADQGRRGDARALHGRVALRADRDLVPHARRHDARRPPQPAQGGGAQGLVHASHRLRDRARGDGADAGDGAALRRAGRQAARDRRRRREPRHRRRRRAQGRRAHPDGPGDPRRGPARLPRLPRGVR